MEMADGRIMHQSKGKALACYNKNKDKPFILKSPDGTTEAIPFTGAFKITKIKPKPEERFSLFERKTKND